MFIFSYVDVYVSVYVLESRGLCTQKRMLEILELECYGR